MGNLFASNSDHCRVGKGCQRTFQKCRALRYHCQHFTLWPPRLPCSRPVVDSTDGTECLTHGTWAARTEQMVSTGTMGYARLRTNATGALPGGVTTPCAKGARRRYDWGTRHTTATATVVADRCQYCHPPPTHHTHMHTPPLRRARASRFSWTTRLLSSLPTFRCSLRI